MKMLHRASSSPRGLNLGLVLLVLVTAASYVVIDASSLRASGLAALESPFTLNRQARSLTDVQRREAKDAVSDGAVTSKPIVEAGSGESTESKINCSLPANVNNTNCATNKTGSTDGPMQSIFTQMRENKAMLLRTMYVTLGVTGIVVFYFVVRAIRLRRRRTKSRKYGIITQHGDGGDMEMEPLGDGDDDDDDYTVFEMNGRKK